MVTYTAKPHQLSKKWYVIDAAGQTLGRLASELAFRLRGKDKPQYTPHVDTGDYFIVINAGKLVVTGNKREDKLYYRHSGYPGGLKACSFADMQVKKPTKALELAVKGMLPKGPLGRQMLKKLKIYPNEQHRHQAQQPECQNVINRNNKRDK